MMTVKEVKAILKLSGTQFFVNFLLNPDNMEYIKVNKSYVQIMLKNLDNDYEIICTNWGNGDYLLG